jgi:hypothetical protein
MRETLGAFVGIALLGLFYADDGLASEAIVQMRPLVLIEPLELPQIFGRTGISVSPVVICWGAIAHLR